MSVEITVRFTGQLRALAGHSSLDLSVAEETTLSDALLALQDVVSPSFSEQVIEPLVRGQPSGALLLWNRALCSGPDLDRPLAEGDVVAFVTPMEGG